MMRLDLLLTVPEDSRLEVADQTSVVIDVLRTGSSIVQAMANGAQEIYPAVSTEEAIKLASSLGREDSMLCGASRYTMTEGFDIGNSPTEFTPERILGKRLVLSTTNGTRVFQFLEDSTSVLVCCLMNLGAVVEEVLESESLTIVCAGSEEGISLEDTICAGLFINRLSEEYKIDLILNDAGRLAKNAQEHFTIDKEFLAGTERGRKLREGGFEGDLDLCSQVDIYSVVPEMREKVVRLMQKDSNGLT